MGVFVQLYVDYRSVCETLNICDTQECLCNFKYMWYMGVFVQLYTWWECLCSPSSSSCNSRVVSSPLKSCGCAGIPKSIFRSTILSTNLSILTISDCKGRMLKWRMSLSICPVSEDGNILTFEWKWDCCYLTQSIAISLRGKWEFGGWLSVSSLRFFISLKLEGQNYLSLLVTE